MSDTASPPRTMFILMGLPGSGKSTFSKSLPPKDFERFCQDEAPNCVGNKRRYLEEQLTKYLSGGGFRKHIVIDRCGFNESQRATWIKIAQRFKLMVVFIYFKKNVEECRESIRARLSSGEKHPSITDEEKMEAALGFMSKNWQDLPMKKVTNGYSVWLKTQHELFKLFFISIYSIVIYNTKWKYTKSFFSILFFL